MYNILMQTAEDIHEHLAAEHRISPIQTYLKEIVYGGTDGIVTTFAVVAGFTGAQAGASVPTYSFLTVLLFGIANLTADGVSMGLGNFLSLRAEKDLYRKEQAKELHEIRNHPHSEKEETALILESHGFTKKQAYQLTELYATNEKYWLRFMMNDELELPNPMEENPVLTGLATFLAFVIFGAIPLLPYVLLQDSPAAFSFAVFSTFLALIILGLLRWRVTGESIMRSVGEIVVLGGISATIAYLVGTLFTL